VIDRFDPDKINKIPNKLFFETINIVLYLNYKYSLDESIVETRQWLVNGNCKKNAGTTTT
jgi:hypothetical protein